MKYNVQFKIHDIFKGLVVSKQNNEQLHGTAMESPVSAVVAEIGMQEERPLATCRQTIPLWLRYVDDTFIAVHKDETDDFHDHLNEQNVDIQSLKRSKKMENFLF